VSPGLDDQCYGERQEHGYLDHTEHHTSPQSTVGCRGKPASTRSPRRVLPRAPMSTSASRGECAGAPQASIRATPLVRIRSCVARARRCDRLVAQRGGETPPVAARGRSRPAPRPHARMRGEWGRGANLISQSPRPC
jgi:hypothetical protein